MILSKGQGKIGHKLLTYYNFVFVRLLLLNVLLFCFAFVLTLVVGYLRCSVVIINMHCEKCSLKSTGALLY